MTERPIIFSGPMVRAILDGRKSQTRRVLKPQPHWVRDRVMVWKNRAGLLHTHSGLAKPGDKLWVRETWTQPAYRPSTAGIDPDLVLYRADHPEIDTVRWRPSIHMPKWAARIWLTVTEVRVQRVQDISEEDARAEGVPGTWAIDESGNRSLSHRLRFSQVWDSIHGPGAFERNDWVAAISFERAQP